MKLKAIKMRQLIDADTFNYILKMAAINADQAIKANPKLNTYLIIKDTFNKLGYNYDNIKIIYP